MGTAAPSSCSASSASSWLRERAWPIQVNSPCVRFSMADSTSPRLKPSWTSSALRPKLASASPCNNCKGASPNRSSTPAKPSSALWPALRPALTFQKKTCRHPRQPNYSLSSILPGSKSTPCSQAPTRDASTGKDSAPPSLGDPTSANPASSMLSYAANAPSSPPLPAQLVIPSKRSPTCAASPCTSSTLPALLQPVTPLNRLVSNAAGLPPPVPISSYSSLTAPHP